MSNNQLQKVKDEILSYKSTISQIENKMNLLKFLDTVDETIKDELNFDIENLLKEKKEIEISLRGLLNEKNALTDEKVLEDLINISATGNSSLQMSNYISSFSSINSRAEQENDSL